MKTAFMGLSMALILVSHLDAVVEELLEPGGGLLVEDGLPLEDGAGPAVDRPQREQVLRLARAHQRRPRVVRVHHHERGGAQEV